MRSRKKGCAGRGPVLPSNHILTIKQMTTSAPCTVHTNYFFSKANFFKYVNIYSQNSLFEKTGCARSDILRGIRILNCRWSNSDSNRNTDPDL